LIELYPFAVPAENYTPYRTLTTLKGMQLVYKAWENAHEENTVVYPDRPRLQGGIRHLPEEDQQKILNTKTVPKHTCCEDPYWLFRIYQDTTVHLEEILKLTEEAINEAEEKVKAPVFRDIKVPKIDGLKCVGSSSSTIHIAWNSPWNGARVHRYTIWVHQKFTEYESETEEFFFQDGEPGHDYHFWVRADHERAGDEQSPPSAYSEQLICSTTD